MLILTLNAGSSSIKYKLFDDQTVLIAGLIEGIGEVEGQWHHQSGRESRRFADHEQAFAALATRLEADLQGRVIEGVGHRVVHGGDTFWLPTIITPDVLAEIHRLARLAPLHNPVNALGIEYAQRYFSNACQIAIFDSGFHHSMPEYVRQYAIDRSITRRYQIQHYGFHGINHEYVAQTAARYLHKPLADCQLISLHLGNGVSACLIRDGKSFDTSMGMTPLAGLIMGTRCGDIDPAIPLYLMQQGMSADQVDHLLNKNSGLKGLTGNNDMRAVLAAEQAGDAAAKLALEMYVYAIQKVLAAYRGQTATLDAVIFTGGVGENASQIRERVMAPLGHLGFALDALRNDQRQDAACYAISSGAILVLVIRSDEEALMAQQVAETLRRS